MKLHTYSFGTHPLPGGGLSNMPNAFIRPLAFPRPTSGNSCSGSKQAHPASILGIENARRATAASASRDGMWL
ncbi:hypothetical protein ACHAQA_004545 [Verticillium albo-atrum]